MGGKGERGTGERGEEKKAGKIIYLQRMKGENGIGINCIIFSQKS